MSRPSCETGRAREAWPFSDNAGQEEGVEPCPRITSRTITRRCCIAAPKDFSRRALLFQVVRANIVVDLNQKDEWLHFDNSAFLAGVEHVEALWASIEAGDECMANFARLTHTVQDFYSHSNWVELHQHLSPLPVWDMNIASLPAGTVSGTYRSGAAAPKLDDPHARRAEQGQPVSLVLTVRLPGRGRRAEPREDTFRTGLRCGSGRHVAAVRTVNARNLFEFEGCHRVNRVVAGSSLRL